MCGPHYSFRGIDNLPYSLWRKMWDDVFVCRHCKNKDIDFRNTVMGSVLGLKPDRRVFCKKCGERLPYLEERNYGVSFEQLKKQYHVVHEPWKGHHPLWANMFGKGWRKK